MKTPSPKAKKRKPESTSARVARIAGQVLQRLADTDDSIYIWAYGQRLCTVGELKALAASALTQATDKPKAKK